VYVWVRALRLACVDFPLLSGGISTDQLPIYPAVDIPYMECKEELKIGATPAVSDDQWCGILKAFQLAKQAIATDAPR
jgi:hypothetical protein